MDRLKLFIRLLEARMTPQKAELSFNGHDIRVVRSFWWNTVEQEIFDAEISPYLGRLYHPRLLMQAYHLRDSARTYERCAGYLAQFGYKCRELNLGSGLMDAAINH